MAKVKTMTLKQGAEYGIGNYPNFHCSGSVIGMKRMFYGENALLVRCGQFIYNVTSNPKIYNRAH